MSLKEFLSSNHILKENNNADQNALTSSIETGFTQIPQTAMMETMIPSLLVSLMQMWTILLTGTDGVKHVMRLRLSACNVIRRSHAHGVSRISDITQVINGWLLESMTVMESALKWIVLLHLPQFLK